MSAKTKIVVLHMKEMIYTLIFAGLGILLILLLIFMFLPKESKKTAETMNYVAGVYTSTIQFNDNTIDVQVVVDESKIQSVSLVNLDETVTTMYPLMEPAVQEIASQVCEKQSTDNIAYSEDNPYTSMVILNAVKSALKKAETAP
ncbi:hypothetical protein AALB52_14655 [Lachnospiraceae bacterium 38-14]|nr:hypothetical protein [Lachnospiraceae bacterium]